MKQVRLRVGKGDKIYFWTDLWVGENTLASTFPELFRCATNHEAKVIEYMERKGDCISWGHTFRRNFKDVEGSQFHSMLTILGSVFIPREGRDRRIQMESSDGFFLVASFLSSLSAEVESHTFQDSLWSMTALPRVIAFGWIVLLGGILTMDNLRQCKVVIVNACLTFLANEESIDHLLLNCSLAQSIWRSILLGSTFMVLSQALSMLCLTCGDWGQAQKEDEYCVNFHSYGHLVLRERKRLQVLLREILRWKQDSK